MSTEKEQKTSPEREQMMSPAREQMILNRGGAIFIFLVSLIMYCKTLAPTVVFWDVGEFIAAAKLMQVPHPPGSPLFLFATRVAMMFPFVSDDAMRAHAFSATCSALGIMFLYLVIVRVIVNFRGKPGTVADMVAVYGSSVIGSLSLAFGTTYWDNSIEAEVYGASMLFLSAIVWLAMRWQERSEKEGNEKYIVLIAYLIGLSLGVHLLALLAVFPVLMIIYFKKYEYTLQGFMKYWLVSVVVFGVVYPGIVKFLPEMMDGEWRGQKNEFIAYIPWLIMLAALYGVYTSYMKKQKVLHIALLSMVLIFLGYTTYTSVLIRSNANPPMNENDPDNLARLTSYLGREQYGDAPVFVRRYSQEPQHQGIYTNYSSDMDFLVRYQLNHMFFRYLGWNYIGQAGDFQDAGVDWHETLALPFLIGLIGCYYQVKKDWKMGLVFITMFIIMGPVLALYQNQQEPQPRERDYFYVGAFFVFSVWIALGVIALIDALKQYAKTPQNAMVFASGAVLLFTAAIPANLVRINYHDHDRSGNYVAWDFSYNLLQTCEKDAILFTNGDNDTFPLWYLQDVEGIRRDVRIVNLSLVNTPWYIQQMKDKPYYKEAQAVPISLSDAQIAAIQPMEWEPKQLVLPVPAAAFARYGVTDTAIVNRGTITFLMKNTSQYEGTKVIRVQDILVHDIVFTNQWKRPVYFAVTGASDGRLGLDEYLWFSGLAWRLEPRKVYGGRPAVNIEALEKNLMHEPGGFSTTPEYGYKFRNIANPDVYFDENTTRMLGNYRSAFLQLATYYSTTATPGQSVAVLDRMEKIVPRSKIPMEWDLSFHIASFYHQLGRDDRFNELASEIEPIARKLIETGQVNPTSYYNPYSALLEIYGVRKEYGKSIELLKSLSAQYPNDPNIKERIDALQAQLKAGEAQ